MKGFRTATMFNQLFPQRADNTYRGYKFALWLFAVVLLLRGFQSLVSVFKGYSTLTVADGIPLDRYTTAGAQTLVSMFAILGFTQFLICLLGVLALARYRNLVPLMFTLLLLQYLGGRLILRLLPVVRIGTPPGFYVNLAILALMIVGLALSLRSRDRGQVQQS